MKKNIFGIFAIILVFTFTSCEDSPVVFDNINGQEAIQFTSTSLNVTVPAEGLIVTLPVSITTVSTVARNFVVVEDESSTAIPGSFSLGSVSIPAGSYDGSLEITLNTTGLADGILYGLVVNLVAPEGGTAFKEQATINYNKEVVCNDLLLIVLTDAFPEETTWEITDSTGTVVASGGDDYGPPSAAASRLKEYQHNITLPDGCYTFTIFDVFGDGLNDGVVEGSFLLTCSILTHASGVGNFGSSDSTDFAVNVECP